MASSKVVCIIPARKGSKRLPGKNRMLLAGKPLISYTIAAAKKSGVFSEIFVSTDDESVSSIAAEEGVLSIKRPESLAGDKITVARVIDEHIKSNEVIGSADVIVVLYPTCPFRNSEDISASWKLFENSGLNGFLFSLSPYDFPPQFAVEFNEKDNSASLVNPEVYKESTQSQSVTRFYHPNGAIFMFNRKDFVLQKTFYGSPLIGYHLPADRALDIDYPEQFEYAEFLISKHGVK